MTFQTFWKALKPEEKKALLEWAGTQNLDKTPTKSEFAKLIGYSFYLTQCDECDEWGIESDRGEWHNGSYQSEGQWYEKTDSWAHYECVDNEHDVTTIVKYSPDGTKAVVKVTKHDDFCETCGDNTCEHINDANAVVPDTKLYRVDAWRAWQEPQVGRGFLEVADGWVTGYPDETISHKNLTFDLHDKLESEAPPVEVWWIYHPTANVFSLSSKVVVRAGDLPALEDWLRANLNTDVEGVKAAFA